MSNARSPDLQQRGGVLSLIVGSVSVIFAGIYFLEWRASRGQAKELAATAADAAADSVRNLSQLVLKNQAMLQRLQVEIDELQALAAREPGPPASEPTVPPEAVDGDPEESQDPDQLLPPLPEEARPVPMALTADLDLLLRDPLINPNGRELNQVDRMLAEKALATARATSDVMESQIRVSLTAGMEKMRERGAFIEYAKGEIVEKHEPDIITAGENGANDSLRLYYFYPDEFPEIYERKREIKDACSQAIRQVMALLK